MYLIKWPWAFFLKGATERCYNNWQKHDAVVLLEESRRVWQDILTILNMQIQNMTKANSWVYHCTLTSWCVIMTFLSILERKGPWRVYRPSSHNPRFFFFAIKRSSAYMNVRVESPFKCTRKSKVVNKIFNHCNRNPDFTSERTKQSETNFRVPTEGFSVTARKYLLETKPPEISEYTWTFSHFFNMLQKILDSYTYTYWWRPDGWKLPVYGRLKYRIK